jgi:UDP-GlcNAc:undecaprenyl-phosphate/decaprenyl-phosphate GlcNAc-1-phosphate transferase
MRPVSIEYYVFFLGGLLVIFLLSVLVSYFFAQFFRDKGVVDSALIDPDKKKHSGLIPLVVGSGAVLIALSAMVVPAAIEQLGFGSFFHYTSNGRWAMQIILFIAAILVILGGGYVDDKYKTKPITQLAVVTAAIALILISGVRISVSWSLLVSPEVWSLVVTAVWLYVCAASTKFLDGHDGLVSSISSIGLLGIASVALIDRIQEPLYALFALVWVFAIAGFLPFNFPKARAYLGEGASIALGFAIGYFSLVLGSKVLVANAVLGLFLLDLIVVWALRIKDGRNFLTSGDRLHWHHRLLDAGLDKLQVLILTSIIVLINVHVAVWLAQNNTNWLAIWQVLGFVLILALLSLRLKKTKQKKIN